MAAAWDEDDYSDEDSEDSEDSAEHDPPIERPFVAGDVVIAGGGGLFRHGCLAETGTIGIVIHAQVFLFELLASSHTSILFFNICLLHTFFFATYYFRTL